MSFELRKDDKMAIVRPFAAVRPTSEFAESVVAPPYDVVNTKEAKKLAKDRPFSFLRVSRSEIDFPSGTDPYSDQVYEKAHENLLSLLDKEVLIKEKQSSYYIYEQTFQARKQTGLVATFSIDDYLDNVIKKHELTLVEKEVDRLKHFDFCNAHTEPVFLTYERNETIQEILGDWTKSHKPLFSFETEDQVGHTLWRITNRSVINNIEEIFEGVPELYIADGHHRSASAVKVGLARRKAKAKYTGQEEFNFFLGVLFPHDELKIYDYNRVVKDLNGLDKDSFFQRLSSEFFITELGDKIVPPERPREFTMYLDGKWYSLKFRKRGFSPMNPVNGLDVSILQNLVLDPILGIKDPRTDDRIEFVGGIRGLGELKKKVDKGMAVAFALYPPSMEDLLKIGGMGLTMPPKSTWFEPKLASGLFIHQF